MKFIVHQHLIEWHRSGQCMMNLTEHDKATPVVDQTSVGTFPKAIWRNCVDGVECIWALLSTYNFEVN